MCVFEEFKRLTKSKKERKKERVNYFSAKGVPRFKNKIKKKGVPFFFVRSCAGVEIYFVLLLTKTPQFCCFRWRNSKSLCFKVPTHALSVLWLPQPPQVATVHYDPSFVPLILSYISWLPPPCSRACLLLWTANHGIRVSRSWSRHTLSPKIIRGGGSKNGFEEFPQNIQQTRWLDPSISQTRWLQPIHTHIHTHNLRELCVKRTPFFRRK